MPPWQIINISKNMYNIVLGITIINSKVFVNALQSLNLLWENVMYL